MTYGISYYWDNATVSSYIGTEDYGIALDHLARLTANPHVHGLKFTETRIITEVRR